MCILQLGKGQLNFSNLKGWEYSRPDWTGYRFPDGTPDVKVLFSGRSQQQANGEGLLGGDVTRASAVPGQSLAGRESEV